MTKPVHSEEALDLAWELQDQSEEVFEKIQNLLPKPKSSNAVSFAQKIAWVFRKGRVEFLVESFEGKRLTSSYNPLCWKDDSIQSVSPRGLSPP